AVVGVFLDVARRRVVGVGRGDEPELVGVHADPSLLAEALEQRIAQEVRAPDAALVEEGALARSIAAILVLGPAPLLVVAELVARAEHVPHAVATLRVALDLR